MTHAELIDRAARWLQGQGCKGILTEPHRAGEQPDAIGWTWRGVSIAVECKASRSDWESDRSKKDRRYRRRLGQFRWYLVAPELMQKPPPPLPALWGLLVCHPKQVRKIVRARRQPLAWVNHEGECQLCLRAWMKSKEEGAE